MAPGRREAGWERGLEQRAQVDRGELLLGAQVVYGADEAVLGRAADGGAPEGGRPRKARVDGTDGGRCDVFPRRWFTSSESAAARDEPDRTNFLEVSRDTGNWVTPLHQGIAGTKLQGIP